ncbi:hypothetical protein C8F01DRAFT_1097863, partial [Mycena amicta]
MPPKKTAVGERVWCICWRCTKRGKQPKGSQVTRHRYNDHRRSDYILFPVLEPLHPTRAIPEDFEDFFDIDNVPDIEVNEAPTGTDVDDAPVSNPPATQPTGNNEWAEGSEGMAGDMDNEMEELSGVFGDVSLGADILERRPTVDREALWEPPEDEDDPEGLPQRSPSPEDIDDADIDAEQAARDFEWYERLAESEKLGASDRLLGEFFSRVIRDGRQLSAHDLRIVRAYAWKLKTHLTDDGFKSMPNAFPELFGEDDGLPGIDEFRSRIEDLSELKAQAYHCCINSCICYVGPYETDTQCMFCKEPRLNKDGKPRKIFSYIPLIPRLHVFFQNREMAEKMQYRADYEKGKDEIRDVFDSELYDELCKEANTGGSFWSGRSQLFRRPAGY